MRRILSSAAVAGAALLLASEAVAQLRPGAGGTRSDVGAIAEPAETVVRVDRNPNQIVVRNAAGQQRTIFLDSATALERQGRTGAQGTPIQMRDVMVGDRIVASGATGTGGFTAQRIQVLSPGGVGAPPVTPTGEPTTPPGEDTPGTETPGTPAPDPGAGAPGREGPTGPGFGGRRNPMGPGFGGSAGTGSGSGGGGSGGE